MGLEFKFGDFKKGKRNLITDVKGIKVGHVTITRNGLNTGVTAIIPAEDNIFDKKIVAGAHIINGFAKCAGVIQIGELGNIETPVIMTSTLSLGTAMVALSKYGVERSPWLKEDGMTISPLVLECNDAYLSDTYSFPITEEDVFEALNNVDEHFEEGDVGAGRGMSAYSLKGGIGSASRIVEIDGKEYTLGCILNSNFGTFDDLTLQGKRVRNFVDEEIEKTVDKGSIVILIATDIPMNSTQLDRVSRRAQSSIAKTGSYSAHNSGEIVVSLSTTNRVDARSKNGIYSQGYLNPQYMDIIFKATVEMVEEAIISSMVHANEVSGNSNTRRALKDIINLDEFMERE